MAKLLNGLGIISIIGGIIIGIIYGIKDDPMAGLLGLDDGFRFSVALACWVSGVISGILFLAFAMMLDLLEANNTMLGELIRRTHLDAPPTQRKTMGKSKALLDSAAGYKMKSLD